MAKKQWQLPPIQEILDDAVAEPGAPGVLKQKRIIEQTLAELGFEAKIQEVRQGPRVTQYSLKSNGAAQLSRINTVERDLAVALSGAAVQIAPPTPSHPHVAILVPPPAPARDPALMPLSPASCVPVPPTNCSC